MPLHLYFFFKSPTLPYINTLLLEISLLNYILFIPEASRNRPNISLEPEMFRCSCCRLQEHRNSSSYGYVPFALRIILWCIFLGKQLPQLATMSYFHYAVIYDLLYYVVIYCLPPMQGNLR